MRLLQQQVPANGRRYPPGKGGLARTDGSFDNDVFLVFDLSACACLG